MNLCYQVPVTIDSTDDSFVSSVADVKTDVNNAGSAIPLFVVVLMCKMF